MTTAAVRDKLYDYIRVADDKKIKAIYMMLEDEILDKVEWWKDNDFMNDLDKRYDAWNTGKDKGYTLSDIETSIEQLKKKRAAK